MKLVYHIMEENYVCLLKNSNTGKLSVGKVFLNSNESYREPDGFRLILLWPSRDPQHVLNIIGLYPEWLSMPINGLIAIIIGNADVAV